MIDVADNPTPEQVASAMRNKLAAAEKEACDGKAAVMDLVRAVLRADPATLPPEIAAYRSRLMALAENGG